MPSLTLYYREGCHLCDAFAEELRGLQARHPFEFNSVDVDSAPALAEKYGRRVPLLMQGEVVICEYFLDPQRLHAHVQ